MYRYEYVTVKATGHMNPTYERYREIINEYAKNGFRCVGFVPRGRRCN
jgi:alpha-beta hydrolase superfamily lysophospholipase